MSATISQSLEANNQHFNEAREKLEKWADDLVLAAEKALKDTKEQIKILQRQARLATHLAEQHDIQQKIQKLEKQQRRQRQEIFQVEDSIIEKRDALIETLERRLTQKTESERLFTIEWEVFKTFLSTKGTKDTKSTKIFICFSFVSFVLFVDK
jgi:predicted  nucleic acid-binding Zn-ribbon protein